MLKMHTATLYLWYTCSKYLLMLRTFHIPNSHKTEHCEVGLYEAKWKTFFTGAKLSSTLAVTGL